MNQVINFILAVLAFPFLFIFYFLFRLITNVANLLFALGFFIYYLFTLNFSLALAKLLEAVLGIIAIVIDLPIGIFVTLIVAFSSSIEIYNSDFNFKEKIESIIKTKH